MLTNSPCGFSSWVLAHRVFSGEAWRHQKELKYQSRPRDTPSKYRRQPGRTGYDNESGSGYNSNPQPLRMETIGDVSRLFASQITRTPWARDRDLLPPGGDKSIIDQTTTPCEQAHRGTMEVTLEEIREHTLSRCPATVGQLM